MAGPIDIGALAGVLGDGQSRNNEEYDYKSKTSNGLNLSKEKLDKVFGKVHQADSLSGLRTMMGQRPANNSLSFMLGKNKVNNMFDRNKVNNSLGRMTYDKYSKDKELTPEEQQAIYDAQRAESVEQAKKEIAEKTYQDTIKKNKETQTKAAEDAQIQKGRELLQKEGAVDTSGEFVSKNQPSALNKFTTEFVKGATKLASTTKGNLETSRQKEDQKARELELSRKNRYEQFQPISKFSTNISGNLGQNISSGRLIGPMEDKGALANVAKSQRELAGYVDYLHKMYKTGGNAGALSARITPKQKEKIQKLQQDIGRHQAAAARGGFLSGTGGATLIQGSIPKGNIQRLTNVATTPEYGTFKPEAYGRFGVSQGLRSDATNKLTSLGIGMKSPEEFKIASILGKTPDPTGESALDKIKRFSKF